MDCASYPLSQHRVVAIATDKYLRPKTLFQDPQNLPGVPGPRYGADLTFGIGRAAHLCSSRAMTSTTAWV